MKGNRIRGTWLAALALGLLGYHGGGGIAYAAERGRNPFPEEKLPPRIQRITWFGERPDWSHDSKRALFVEKTFGDVYEYELETGRIKPVTQHFKHHGFTRALYLSNGDILLSGPSEAFDATVREERGRARSRCWLSVLDQNLTEPPTPLGVLCAEGPAVSRSRLKIAWSQTHAQRPERLGNGHSIVFVSDIVYDDGGAPRLADQRMVLDSRELPFKLNHIETQNFVPPADDALTLAFYRIEFGTDTETYTLDLDTGQVQNQSQDPDAYDEPEGIFPDGHGPSSNPAPATGGRGP